MVDDEVHEGKIDQKFEFLSFSKYYKLNWYSKIQKKYFVSDEVLKRKVD